MDEKLQLRCWIMVLRCVSCIIWVPDNIKTEAFELVSELRGKLAELEEA